MNDMHSHPVPRRWWLIFGFAALLIVALTMLGSGIAGPTVAAQDGDPLEVTPETTPTDELYPTSDPFPVTETMTDTMQAALDAYLLEQTEHRIAGTGPIQVEGGWVRLFAPWIGIEQATPTATPTTPPPTVTPTTPPTVTPRRPTPTTKPQGNPADMANTLWPAPSIRVKPGDKLEYEIRAKNYGKGDANVNRVTLPFNKDQLTVVTARFTKNGDWISELTNDHITVNFNAVAPGEVRKATIVFQVKGNLPDNAVISMRATTNWSDERNGGSGPSNWAPILVGKTNDTAQWTWLTVEPLGGYAGTNHRFFSDRFIPGEGVVTWLNTPTGAKALDLKGVADASGRVTMDFRSTNLNPGTYSLVFFGSRSNLTAIATFYVWPR